MKQIYSKEFVKISARRSQWNQVPGWLGIEIVLDPSLGIKDLSFGKQLPVALATDLANRLRSAGPDSTAELIVRLHSSGFTDAGSMYGGEDQLGWHPESEDERIVTSIDVEINGKKVGKLPGSIVDEISELYENEIYHNAYMPEPADYGTPDDEMI